ncbi:MAG: tRNA (adenosine(37)-N6)-threonylcarbamoyltransferase complex ATPase subunit type 1 TsaE [Anaeroplasma sp.]
MKEFITNNQDETIKLGEIIGSNLSKGDVVLLTGDLSAGKTTITKGIGKSLGVKAIINSPTFTIVKTYVANDITLYHLDLYRLEGLNEDFDLEEYIETDGVCVIEWPFQVSELIPDEYLMIELNIIDDSKRIVKINGLGRYKRIEEML